MTSPLITLLFLSFFPISHKELYVPRSFQFKFVGTTKLLFVFSNIAWSIDIEVIFLNDLVSNLIKPISGLAFFKDNATLLYIKG